MRRVCLGGFWGFPCPPRNLRATNIGLGRWPWTPVFWCSARGRPSPRIREQGHADLIERSERVSVPRVAIANLPAGRLAMLIPLAIPLRGLGLRRATPLARFLREISAIAPSRCWRLHRGTGGRLA